MSQSEVSKENELLLNIRQRNREDIHKFQLNKRLSTVDRQRCGLTEISAAIQEQELLTEKDVQGLSSRIKRRKSAKSTDLKRLSAAFLHNSKNIEIFCKIPGAVNVVVKELSGTDTENQVFAAECLCNLALGEDFCSTKVAQVAGSYLVLYLCDGVSNKRLVETCLWVIQNLLLSGEKTQKILIAQGLPDKLTSLLHGTKDIEIATAAEETFSILVVEAWKDLPEGFSSKALELLTQKMKHLSSLLLYPLYFILMELNFTVNAETLTSSVKFSTEALITATQGTDSFDFSQCLISVRIITNALLSTENSELVSKCLFDQLTHQNYNFSTMVNKLFSVDNEQISRETLWMLSTVCKVSKFQNVKIPVKFL